jgi:hypothetical protein
MAKKKAGAVLPKLTEAEQDMVSHMERGCRDKLVEHTGQPHADAPDCPLDSGHNSRVYPY